jgi:hypothetical protein
MLRAADERDDLGVEHDRAKARAFAADRRSAT